MTSDELRNAFLKFFENKGHTIVPSSSLVPHGDPTLLLTNSGMVQMKPYFTGESVPPNPRMVSCQKCFRTTDIEAVGDVNHCTFFEMLGNFSVGDYFKKEAINWGWEFVTEYLKIQPERLWITIFLDDDEAFNLWREIGIPEEKIKRYGEKDNFWGPAGDSGPCGPCSEIHYDFGEEVGCGRVDCEPNCECDRFTEIWNLVFTQYDQDSDGKRTPLPRRNIDTGSGLERVASVLQGKTNIYDTDLFAPLIEHISKLSGKRYGENDDDDTAMRVVSEHSRSIAFLIADGVMPGNEGRGYVLRRLLRRAVLFGRRLGLENAFLSEMAKTSIKQMSHVYPELSQREEFIVKVIDQEETSFEQTLTTGLELLEGIIHRAIESKGKQVSGEEVFKLYDTYGFPVELTKEVTESNGLSIDIDGFETEMEKQRERAKSAHRFENAEKDELSGILDINDTIFTGYDSLSQASTILNLLIDNKLVNSVSKGQQASVILADTPFYAEMGGQVGDTGEITTKTGSFKVTGTIKVEPGIIVHRGEVTEGSFSDDEKVHAEVDVERRSDIARNHTATHLLQAALREVLGDYVQQRGSLVAPDHFRFDFSHLVAMTREELDQVQQNVNNRIRQNLDVYTEEIPYREAIASGAIALFGEKYTDFVRVLSVGNPPVSSELCGGTHVSKTGEIGFLHITSESSIGAGIRRIEAVTGRGAEAYLDKRLTDLDKIAGYVEADRENAAEKVENLTKELKSERRKIQALERKLARRDAHSLENNVTEIGGVKVLAEKVPPAGMDNLREMSDNLRDKLGDAIIVLGTVWQDRPAFLASVSQGLADKGYNAGKIVKKLAELTGGSGGGRPTMAQGGGKDKDKLDEALKQVFNIIEEMGSS